MHRLGLEPDNLRDWLAAVGVLRLLSETTDNGRLRWHLEGGQYRAVVTDAGADFPARASAWVTANAAAWSFGGADNVNFDAAFWRDKATAASGIEATLWCAIASDAVLHKNGEKLQASVLEYAHGGGHQDWLGSLRDFMTAGLSIDAIEQVLHGRREVSNGAHCRWDPAAERNHAYRAIAPTKDPIVQDQALNTLAAIGFASCPTAPTARGLVMPLATAGNALAWPVWTDALRLAELEAALCCGWSWPTMTSRRWLSGKLYCFSRGALART